MTAEEKLLSFLHEGVADLETYLLSDILYWQLHAGSGQQRFTLGGLLLGLIQIKAMREENGTSDESLSTQIEIDRVKLVHRTAWGKKAGQEISARVRLWKTFLEDYRQNPDEMAVYYPREVRWRVFIHLLQKEISDPVKELELLPGLDRMVQSNWLPGDFIWEPYLMKSMPEPEFWFLYGRLKQ